MADQINDSKLTASDSRPTDFLENLYEEKLKHKEHRHAFVVQKLLFIIGLFGLGVLDIKGGDEHTPILFNTGILLYLVPFVALAYDVYIHAEDFKVKRVGLFVRCKGENISTIERDWEKWVSSHREELAEEASKTLTWITFFFSAVLILFLDAADPFGDNTEKQKVSSNSLSFALGVDSSSRGLNTSVSLKFENPGVDTPSTTIRSKDNNAGITSSIMNFISHYYLIYIFWILGSFYFIKRAEALSKESNKILRQAMRALSPLTLDDKVEEITKSLNEEIFSDELIKAFKENYLRIPDEKERWIEKVEENKQWDIYEEKIHTWLWFRPFSKKRERKLYEIKKEKDDKEELTVEQKY